MDIGKLRDMLTRHEGSRPKPYVDTVGKITIGVGRNLTDVGLSTDEIDYLLGNDINGTLAFLARNAPWFAALDEVRQRAIADATFDLRGSILGFHDMIAALERGDWKAAHDELLSSTFARETGQRAQDLSRMLLTGQDA